MAINTFIFTVIILIIVQAILFSTSVLKKIRYQRRFTKQAVFAGDTVEMKETIENDKLLPVPWVRLASRMDKSFHFHKQHNLEVESEQFLSSLFSLTSYQKIIRTHKVTCLNRGYYFFGEAQVTSGDLIGLIKKYKNVEAPMSLLVYPKILSFKELPIPSHQLQGDYFVRRWIAEDPFMNAGIREYQSGDSMRSVNWKASAKSQQLQVNKKDYTADYRLMIYVNFDEDEDIRIPVRNTDQVEKAISYAASIAYYTTAKGIPTGFGCNGYFHVPKQIQEGRKNSVRVEPRTGKSHFYQLLKTMAKLKLDRSVPFYKYLKEDIDQNRQKTDYLIIGTYSSPRIEENIKQLQRKGNTVDYIWLNEADTKVNTDERGHVHGA